MRKIKLTISLLILVLILAACSSSGEDNSDSSSGKDEIRFGYWDKKQEDLMKDLVKNFNEEHPEIDVKLELTPYDQYFTKLDAAASGGSLPDVFWMNGPNIAKYASNDMLEPIDDYIADNEVDLENYPEGLRDLYKFEDETYAIPKDYDSVGLWYNKELFDKAGIDYPDDSWNWDDMVEAAEKITDIEDDVYGFGASIADSQASYFNVILMNDGYVLSDDLEQAGFDDENTIEALEKYYNLIDESEVSPTHEQFEVTDANEMFESGKLGMIFQASYMIPEFKKNEYTNENVDVAVLPKLKKRTGVIHGLGNVISANSNNKESAWKFVEYLSSKEANELQAEHGIIPAYEGTESAWLDEAPNFNLQAFLDMADISEPYPVSIDTQKWSEIMQNTLAKAWSGSESIEDTSLLIDEKIEEILANEK